MAKNYKVIRSPELSRSGDSRYIVVDAETERVLDNAQGYGYKSAQKAHMAYQYKTRDRSRDKEKEEKTRKIKQWMKEHKSFVSLMDDIAFEIETGQWGPDDKFDTKFLKKLLKDNELEPDFKASELLRVWQKI